METSANSSTGAKHLPYLMVRVMEQTLAFPADCVQEMLLMPQVTSVPLQPAAVRGVINIRGNVMPMLDLRVHLGLPSHQQEVEDFVNILKEREQDHRNWIKELEASVREKRPFTLARDPHKCKFGKWYDTFVPRTRQSR